MTGKKILSTESSLLAFSETKSIKINTGENPFSPCLPGVFYVEFYREEEEGKIFPESLWEEEE